MKTIDEINQKMAENERFECSPGSFKFTHLRECMNVIALKKILDDPREDVIIERTKTLIDGFYGNSSNMRGMADKFEIECNLWVLGKTLDDFEKMMGIVIT
jgi:hypothetical protein